ncbi:hypothetical protein V6N11_009337 [Hibiscus sabdariffa]|uniref:Uncharacterized protein n=1 Tax=Hibiscus sabdariffa TaxID=183260 RepID=A0ABR1ZAT5_9ROSI
MVRYSRIVLQHGAVGLCVWVERLGCDAIGLIDPTGSTQHVGRKRLELRLNDGPLARHNMSAQWLAQWLGLNGWLVGYRSTPTRICQHMQCV